MITGIVLLQFMQFFMNVGSVSGTFGTMKKIAQIMDTDSEPDGGDGIGKYSLTDWRDRFAVVSQRNPLIGGTVRENIAYGLDCEVSDEELAETARRANFSGGQGQCISIARAMLRNADHLLLDEATGNLDIVSEAEVTGAMDELLKTNEYYRMFVKTL